MFKVKDKYTEEIFAVYAVNGTRFLIWRYDQWWYEDINNFLPVED